MNAIEKMLDQDESVRLVGSITGKRTWLTTSMSKRELNDAQKLQVAVGIADDLGLSELQKRLKSDLDLTLTYMDVRCLVNDLGVVSRDPEG